MNNQQVLQLQKLLEQLYKNTSDPNWGYSYYDDPRDQARIMQGVDIYDLWH